MVPTGLDAAGYRRGGLRPREPFTIGYLSVIRPAKGLDLLVEAASILRRQQRKVVLAVAGQIQDKAYWRAVEQAVDRGGLRLRFHYYGQVDWREKLRLLHQCSVFAMPSRLAESRAVSAMEAMAAGVPVVGPRTGVFPDLVERLGSGVLFESGDADSLAGAIARVMDDAPAADAMGRRGAEGIEREYSPRQMAERTIRVYENVTAAVCG